jgi:hypothetical protein
LVYQIYLKIKKFKEKMTTEQEQQQLLELAERLKKRSVLHEQAEKLIAEDPVLKKLLEDFEGSQIESIEKITDTPKKEQRAYLWDDIDRFVGIEIFPVPIILDGIDAIYEIYVSPSNQSHLDRVREFDRAKHANKRIPEIPNYLYCRCPTNEEVKNLEYLLKYCPPVVEGCNLTDILKFTRSKIYPLLKDQLLLKGFAKFLINQNKIKPSKL